MGPTTIGQFLQEWALVIGICMASAAVGGIALLIVAAYQISELEVDPDADFFTTLQQVPITVPLALDLLDMAFDIFAAPIAWIVLELLGLPALQAVTIFEGLIPGTQLIPTLTAAWVIARIMKKKQPTELQTAFANQELSRRRARYEALRGDRMSSSLTEQYRQKALGSGRSGDDVLEGEVVEDWDERQRDYRAEQERRYEEDLDAPLEYFDDDGEEW